MLVVDVVVLGLLHFGNIVPIIILDLCFFKFGYKKFQGLIGLRLVDADDDEFPFWCLCLLDILF